jgi:antitoxin VapB
MALNLKNPDVERLVDEIVAITGESKTEAIRRALEERREKLALRRGAEDRARRIRIFLEEVWRSIPRSKLGKPLARGEKEAILGYGPEGV